MHAVVVYESMFGSTRRVAEAVGDGLRQQETAVDVCSVHDADGYRDVDLLVIGAPTHTWGMSRPSTRQAAVEQAARPDSQVTLEPEAGGTGVREWLDHLPFVPTRVAVFDTRMHAPLGLSGSAARRISRRIRSRGFERIGKPQGFRVNRRNRLDEGEVERAQRWGAELANRYERSS